MMEATPATALEVPEPKFLLKFLIVTLDPPAQLGQSDQTRSCPSWWCRIGAPWRVGPPCQVAMAGRLTGAVPLTVPRVSRLM